MASTVDMAFTVTGAGGGGLTYSQLRRAGFWIPTRGVRACAGEEGWMAEVEALALVLPEPAVLSHSTAAALLNLPLPESDPRPHHVTVAPPLHRGRRLGVVWHRRCLDGATDAANGLPVTSPLRTFFDLSSTLDVADLVAIADVLLRRELCTREEMLALRGVHGKKMREILVESVQLADGNSWSPKESHVRVALVKAGLPPPECNGDVVEEGLWLGVGDLLWRQFKVIADYDGDHHEIPKQRHQDAQTRDDYAAHGWRHVTLTKRMSYEQMTMRVSRALRSAGWNPGC